MDIKEVIYDLEYLISNNCTYTQIIDYVVNNMYEKNNYITFEASATDTKYKKINIIISISNNSNNVIITIGYPNFAYAYICKVITI